MKIPYLQILVLAFVPMTLRVILYLVACKLRSIDLPVLNAIVIAGAGAVVGFVPLPIPVFLRPALVIGVAMFLFARFTEADLYPDVVFIPLAIELSSSFLVEAVFIPALA
jgi:hypothetical protein